MIQELVPASQDHFLALLRVLGWKAGDFRLLLENDLDSSDGQHASSLCTVPYSRPKNSESPWKLWHFCRCLDDSPQ